MLSHSYWLGVVLLFTALNVWYTWRVWQRVRANMAFTADDKTVLGFQLVCVAILIMEALVGWLLPVRHTLVGFVISLPFVIFIGLTSIIYRVSIFVPRGEQQPAQGGRAIVIGVFIVGIILLLIMIEGFPF